MSLPAIDHLYVETHSFERTLRFWEALGFAVESRWGEAGHHACRLVSGTAVVDLAEAPEGSKPQGPTVHFALCDAEAMQERIAAAGIGVPTPLSPTHWGTRWIRVEDPDGREWVLETARESRPRVSESSPSR